MEVKNLLVVDDEPAVCEILSALLEQSGYSVLTETDGRRTLPLLQEGAFDAVLLDLVMPSVNGLDLIEEIRRHFNVLPIVVVTGHGSVDVTVEAMRRGASDFVTKPVDGPLLDLRVRRAFDLEYARRLAITDGLTGTYNHRYLQERLAEELDRASRYERDLAFMMLDLDHFKAYNDEYGHPRGDRALIEVAQILRQVSRRSDVVARYGGEEFAMILPETGGAEAEVVAERARECVARLSFDWETDEGPHLTLSAGIAVHAQGTSQAALIRAADQALYQAKHCGRDRVWRVTDGYTQSGRIPIVRLPLDPTVGES